MAIPLGVAGSGARNWLSNHGNCARLNRAQSPWARSLRPL